MQTTRRYVRESVSAWPRLHDRFELVLRNGRKGILAFEALYGLHLAIVCTICAFSYRTQILNRCMSDVVYQPTTDTLNLHATILASDEEPNLINIRS
jgi:hypothetical protein